MSSAPLSPLTHHQILQLVAPYARAGRQLDLAASQRDQRRLAFKPRPRALETLRPDGAAQGDGQAHARPEPEAHEPAGQVVSLEVQEWLELEVYPSGSGQLTRTLVHPSGLHATVRASGTRTADLLARVQAVPPQRQFQAGAGYVLARSYVVSVAGSEPVFDKGEVLLDGLNLKLSVPALRGVSADLQLQIPPPPLGQPLDLPQDLLAVLGWNWARLIPTALGWKTKLRLRGTPARRTARAEQALGLAAVHLAQVLAEPPGDFHDRHLAARLGVVFRRAIPVLTPLVLVATIVLMPRVDTGLNPGLWLLVYHVPTLLVVLSFCMQELPQLEIPPWPRRSRAPDWQGQPSARHGARRLGTHTQAVRASDN